ncbi:hypothetical protein AOL_s00075g76 [Orbilia oligospora ATCC 24927]|uniref:AMP-activated protein kinase glycogen-binding domain-containing protein n=1 Tax=Arthrobotrys oligospora (strain ATCC 24927 / CBS 115.81 / DSM 1491) TaxID=756982 RepID=G1X877_ARTOA|nr:hypothetical protein AOL_s00075g76 [Orbilia oligospora ATCC 24927]EGX50650.1 hypothetical protein AOL_s00075g76 [Orbilia oligospora ATCC 24927]
MSTGKGTFSFKWSEPAEEVYVTGSFDNWTKSEKLTKTADGSHVGVVTVPIEKNTYKYVVDGTWTTDPKQRVEQDASGNDNNYLLVEDIIPTEEPTLAIPAPIPDTSDATVTPFLHSAGGGSTTAALAAEVPLEPKKEKAKEPEPVPEATKEPDTIATLPVIESQPPLEVFSSIGPESTTAALAAEVPLEVAAKQDPIVPEATKAVVAPEDLPTPDPKSVPGYLPDTIEEKDEVDQVVSINPFPASETADNPIQLAPNDPIPPHTASITDNVKLDRESYEHADASNLGVGATAAAALAAVTGAVAAAVDTSGVKNLIPESSLPAVGIADAVKSLLPEAVVGKVEKEEDHSTATTEVVPPVVVESQEKAGVDPEASGNPAAVEAKKEVEDELVEKVEKAAPEATTDFPRADVPEVVRESQAEAGVPLEASASPIAVEAKKEIEAELKSEVKPVEPIAEEPVASPSETPLVPAVVAASIEKAGVPAEATANPVAVEAKAIVEEAITKSETKPETLEPPKAEEAKVEEPSTTEKVTEAAEKVVEKVTPEAPKTEAPPAPTTEAPPVPTTEAPAAPTTEAPAAPTTEAPAAPTTEAPAAPTTEAPEAPKTEAEAPKTEVNNGEASADAAKDKEVKKKRRVSAFFHKFVQKLK